MSLIDFQKNDLLVQIKEDSKWCKSICLDNSKTSFKFPYNEYWKKFYKKVFDLYKETGSQTACITKNIVTWKYKNEWIKSTFQLVPLEIQLDKNSNEIIFQMDLESIFINPFIEKQFLELFGLELNKLSNDELIEKIEENPTIQQIENDTIIGQFHYHRHLFLKELEEIEQNDKSKLIQLLFDHVQENEFQRPLDFPNKLLLNADPIQQEILTKVGKESFVLQGPPGTGKSQVVVNVLGKSLMTDKTYACVSEKKSALDVIQKKLDSVGLSVFAVYLDDQIHLKSVYEQFKRSWQLLESVTTYTDHHISPTTLLKAKLQLLINRIQTKDLSSGISFWELKQLKNHITEEVKPDTTHSISIAEWNNLKSKIDALKTLPFEIWSYFSFDFWKDKKWNELQLWIEKWEQYKSIFVINEIQDLKKLNQWCVIYQIQQTAHFEDFKRIVTFKTNWRKYLKFKKQYLQFQHQKALVQEKIKTWKFVPTSAQIQDWKNIQSKTFGKKKIEKILNQEISNGISLETVENISNEWYQFQELFLQCQQDLAEFNIFYPEQDFATIDWIYKHYNSVEESSWISFEHLTANQKAIIQKDYQQLLNFSKAIPSLNIVESEHIQKYITVFQANLPIIQKVSTTVSQLPNHIFYWMQRKSSFKEVESQIICNEWHQFEQLFPEMATLNLPEIKYQLEAIISAEDEELSMFQEEILTYRKQQFERLHQIILNSPRKLSDEEKQFRKELKNGKTILIKEMNKTKQFLPLRELWSSDAKHWLQILTPIWLMTPTQLAKHFPMEENLFQLAMIDEASQLPISHALGTLQRSVQVIIAGDNQQMAPSNFFKSEKEIDVLNFSQFYLPNYHLKYHYRSQHPSLIHFSNQYFYGNELEVFSSNYAEVNPIEWIFVENGRYIEKCNIEEARIVAIQIQKAMYQDTQLGIVAFSESQLQVIWNEMDSISQEKLSIRLDNNSAFFKSLDKVQGDECDTLIISFGYGKNEDGDFHLHLGPILQQGEEKRLNVLFSRAKKKIIFISSIKAEDFPISDNLSVELLRKYFLFLESGQQETFIVPPNLKNWVDTIQNVDELATKYRIYRERGWEF